LVAALAESLGLTQRELAERMNVSEARISQILSGKGNLTLNSLATLGWATGVRFHLVPEGIEDRHATPAAADPVPPWVQRLQRHLAAGFRLKNSKRMRTFTNA
jgi:transcriptional regulator with XRE-family HTH domain